MDAQEWTRLSGTTNAPSGPQEAELLELGRRVAQERGYQTVLSTTPPTTPRRQAMDKAAPVARQRVFELADRAIGLFLTFRDQHGYGEEAARSLAVSEVMADEAARADRDPDEGR
jgi:hypothetical protein